MSRSISILHPLHIGSSKIMETEVKKAKMIAMKIISIVLI